MSNNDSAYDVDIERSEESAEVTISGEIAWEELEKQRPRALEMISQNVKIDGFRDKKVPEEVLLKHVDEMRVLNEMAQLTLQSVYPQIIKEHDIDALGRPDVQITKLSKGNPLGFVATTQTMPDVELPDYTSIAKEVNKKHEEEVADGEEAASDKDVDEAIDQIRERWARADKFKEAQQNAEEGAEINPQNVEVTEDDWPEVDDEFVSQLGDYETVDDFKTALRDNITADNERKQNEKRRGEMLERIANETKASIPDVVVDQELNSMMAQFEADVQRSGMDLEEYFEKTEQSQEELRDQWRPDAKKRAKIQFVLGQIAQEEEISPDEEEVEEQTKMLLEQYDDADETRARMYVQSQLQNQAVLDWLEQQ